ncbi:MAG: transposase [Candidatus Accumulibacter sp.]|nr:transposase [Accumulibacter sp.]
MLATPGRDKTCLAPLRTIHATARPPDADPCRFFLLWLSWACLGRLEPCKRLARTVTTHLTGILNGFEAGRHSGRVQAMNPAPHEARARATGYRRVENFVATTCLSRCPETHSTAHPTVRPDGGRPTPNGVTAG